MRTARWIFRDFSHSLWSARLVLVMFVRTFFMTGLWANPERFFPVLLNSRRKLVQARKKCRHLPHVLLAERFIPCGHGAPWRHPENSWRSVVPSLAEWHLHWCAQNRAAPDTIPPQPAQAKL